MAPTPLRSEAPDYSPEPIVTFMPGSALLDIDGLKDGAKLGTFIIDPPDPDYEANPKPDFPVVIDDGPGEGQAIASALWLIHSRVLEVLRAARHLPEFIAASTP